jgi:antitoxin (DNA-binding transcriptional repressor) of toxin-antitoxin stability system
MTDHEAPRRIDAADLPADVVALLDGIAPGADLVVTRAGRPLAMIRRAPEPEDCDRVAVVVTAMKLSERARTALSAELGAGHIVLDLGAAPATADVVLVPPGSPQLIGRLRAQFPDARIVVTEIDDPELGVSFRGPVGRLLAAGAEAYLPASTVPRLAAGIAHAMDRRQLTNGAAERRAIGPR